MNLKIVVKKLKQKYKIFNIENAEDIAQNQFLRLLERGDAERLKNGWKAMYYAYLGQEVWDFYNKKEIKHSDKRKKELSLFHLNYQKADTADSLLDKKQQLELLTQAMGKLKDKQRLLLTDRYINEMDWEDLTIKHKTASVDATRERVKLAVKNLRRNMIWR